VHIEEPAVKLAVIGANGRTGIEVVEQALSRGHQVAAIARRPEQVHLRDARLSTSQADALDAPGLTRSLAGASAVISTLGVGSSRAATNLYSQGTANIVAAMRAHGIRSLAVVSAAPVGPRAEQPFLERRVLMPILDRVFGATYADMRRMEEQLAESDVDWVALRPPRLVDRKAAGHYRLRAGGPLAKARRLTYADLATALLDSLDRPELRGVAAYVAN
jgi:putative NADH-flavin reductase